METTLTNGNGSNENGSNSNTKTTTTTTTAASTVGPSVSLDSNQVFKRLKTLYDSWKDDHDTLWKSADSLVLAMGFPDEDNPYQKVISLQTWLFGYELRETIFLFLKKEIHIVSGPKEIKLFESMNHEERDTVVPPFVYHTITKVDGVSNNNKECFDKILSSAKKEGNNIGVIIKEKFIGEFGKLWEEEVEKSGLNKVDITIGLSTLLMVKDVTELNNLFTSARITEKVLKSHLLP
eukprot:gene5376-6709_t